jgi:2-polyprenyl-3-methyl-5-hydroxy-6-metoxy-1,4-benzoquinol methylase
MPPANSLRIQALADGRRRISLETGNDFHAASRRWVTAYPAPLIEAIYSAKGLYLCDEIMRDEDPRYVERSIRHDVLGYVDAAEFAGKRILDFGCGAGASTMVLRRLLPPCEIVGVDLEERLLRLARLRAEHYGHSDLRFLESPSPEHLPHDLGLFDYVLFSAVFEHLLPRERPALLRLIWTHMKPGAILFLNQTPHRYSPVEMHTTSLPLINYLPDPLALRAARLSRNVSAGATWEQLLRGGIRGGTIREILGLLNACGKPVLLAPLPHVGDLIDLWYGKLSQKHAWLKKGIRLSLKAIKACTGAQLMPGLALAIRKQA